MRFTTTPRTRGWLALLAAAVACAVPTLSATPATAAAAEGDRSSFLLGVLPDTQFYSRYSIPSSGELYMNQWGSEPYIEQTKWLVANKDNLEIPFVTHLGDIVDRVNQTAEWDVADQAMKVLEQGNLPYSILAGNHDVTGNPATEPFPVRFPASRAAAQSTFGGRDATGMNEWHDSRLKAARSSCSPSRGTPTRRRSSGPRTSSRPTRRCPSSSRRTTSWASPATPSRPSRAPSRRLWDQLIEDTDQIFLTINGHDRGAAHMRRRTRSATASTRCVWDYHDGLHRR